VAPVHDFVRKLRQAPLHARVAEYVAWQKARRAALAANRAPPPLPDWAPLSLNLDLTTACNYACDHCIDWDILNSGVSHDGERLRASLAALAEGGLRSVILIGGGEPTVHPRFRETVRFLKSLDLQVAVVTNGSRNERLLDVMDVLDEGDWLRLSLDAGTDATFQAMHHPRKPITLEAICAGVPPLKAANPAPRVGFSFVITWDGGERAPGAPSVVENVDEIPAAARLARAHGFDYVSYKPLLTRTPEGAEVMDPQAARARQADVQARMRERLAEARTLARADFAVLESVNLQLLERDAWRRWTRQPRTCHMQALRQVLSPLGLWNCPAHRGVAEARVADADAWSSDEARARAVRGTEEILERFDAAHACREVTCLYHDANWWIENAIASPAGLPDGPLPDEGDGFL
jgi:MoaA/NifB/PqqE/SkfB family radical SAM enzyme